jgi:hypothetical protein
MKSMMDICQWRKSGDLNVKWDRVGKEYRPRSINGCWSIGVTVCNMMMTMVMMMEAGMIILQNKIWSGTMNKRLLRLLHCLLQDGPLQEGLLWVGLLQAHLLCHLVLSPILVPRSPMSVISLTCLTALLKHWLPDLRIVLPPLAPKPIFLIHSLAMIPRNFPNYFWNATSTFAPTPCTSRPIHLRSTSLCSPVV